LFESNLGKMKNTFKPRLLTRSFMRLFVPKRGVNPHTRYPDEYYGRISFNKALYNGIELVAKIERINKKAAAQELIERGFSRYMGEKLEEYAKNEVRARDLNQKLRATRFILELRRFAKDHGMDISKFI
jgi:hypothetical protein